MLVEAESHDTIMTQMARVVDCTTAEAKQLTSRDEIPQHPRLVGHAHEDNLQNLVDLLYDERIGSDRPGRVNPWLKDRHNERGVAGADNIASLCPCLRPDNYHGFDDELRETAFRWNTPRRRFNRCTANVSLGSFLSKGIGRHDV